MVLRYLATLQLDKLKLETVRYVPKAHVSELEGPGCKSRGWTLLLWASPGSRAVRVLLVSASETFSPELLIVNLLFPLERLKSTYDLTGKPRLWVTRQCFLCDFTEKCFREK